MGSSLFTEWHEVAQFRAAKRQVSLKIMALFVAAQARYSMSAFSDRFLEAVVRGGASKKYTWELKNSSILHIESYFWFI